MSLIVVLVIVSTLLWLYKLLTPPSKQWRDGNRIPGPKPLPIIGNGLIFVQQNRILLKIYELCDVYGSCMRLWLGKQLFVILSDPDDVEFFLASNKYLDKSDSYRMLDAWLGNKGLLTSDGDVWRPHRKLLTPSFHFKILETSVEMMRRNANILCEQLHQQVDQPEFDILEYVEKCSLDIVCEGAMGTRLETQRSNNTAYLNSIKSVTSMIVKRASSPWLFCEYVFQRTRIGCAFFKELKSMKTFAHQVMEERRKALMIGNHSAPEEVDHTRKKQVRPFLDFMLLESNFTNEEIENEVQTFMFAGHDTTTTTISFCLYLLSKHPDVQDKVLHEMRSMLENPDTKPSYSDYVNMKYLECVIKETLRIYTTVPIISRKVPEEITLPSGHILPAGSLANMFLYHMHNNEKYFPNPNQFLPERFESRENSKHTHAFVPFSAGPRNCIGQKFAMLEMKAVLSMLILKYRFVPAQRVQSLTLETGIVLRSLENIPVRITNRESTLAL